MLRRILFATLLSAPVAAQPPGGTGIVVRAGESLTFAIENGEPVGVRTIAPGDAPASGEVAVAVGEYQGTVLMIRSAAPMAFDYRAFLRRRDGDAEEATSTCTVTAQTPVVEHWPYAVAQVRLTRFTPATTDGIVCR